MKSIVCDLPHDHEFIEIHTFADLHIDDAGCDMKHILERLKYVQETPNAYLILNGDIINNATKTSVSDSYAEKIPPMEQIQKCLDLFEPVKDKILAITSGNHENRTYNKEGIDIMGIVSAQLGIDDKYAKEGAYVYVKFGNWHNHSADSQSVRIGTRGRYTAVKIHDISTVGVNATILNTYSSASGWSAIASQLRIEGT